MEHVFKEKVGANTAREICRLAKECRTGATGYAEAILIAYNYKTRKGLDFVMLYSGKENKQMGNKPLPRNILLLPTQFNTALWA